MKAGLKALQAALDTAVSPACFFLRDDDAGWDDARLFALLDCTELAGVPIELAVIPQACSDDLARALCARMDGAQGQINVHQHGFAHVSHETVDRKCEFGGARDVDQQREDLCKGRQRLRDLFGTRLGTIFTPPWNRCATYTPALLAQLGYSRLSRDYTASAQCALPELPVHLDWCKARRTAMLAGEDCGDYMGIALARFIAGGHPVGVMLHHAEMDAADLALLDGLLSFIAGHPRASWVAMDAVAGTQHFLNHSSVTLKQIG